TFVYIVFFFSSRRRHTRSKRDWSSDVCSSDLNVLSDDQQRLAHFGRLFEQRQQILHRADLLLVDQDVHVLEYAFHTLRVGHKVRSEERRVGKECRYRWWLEK